MEFKEWLKINGVTDDEIKCKNHDFELLNDVWDVAIDSMQEEIKALRGFCEDYLEELINDCSYRNEKKESVYQDYINCLKHVLKSGGSNGRV